MKHFNISRRIFASVKMKVGWCRHKHRDQNLSMAGGGGLVGGGFLPTSCNCWSCENKQSECRASTPFERDWNRFGGGGTGEGQAAAVISQLFSSPVTWPSVQDFQGAADDTLRHAGK